MAWKIKKGDLVYIMSGDDKGAKGKVLKVDREKSRIIVEGVNVKVRHVRPSVQHPEGGMIKKEASLHISNVALADPKGKESLQWDCALVTRVGFRFNEEGKKERYAKRSGASIP